MGCVLMRSGGTPSKETNAQPACTERLPSLQRERLIPGATASTALTSPSLGNGARSVP